MGNIQAEVCVICRNSNNLRYPTKTELDNCFIIYMYLYTESLPCKKDTSYLVKKTHVVVYVSSIYEQITS